MKIGYSRVSTTDQEHDRQIKILQEYGCEKIYQDKISGAKAKRPGLSEMMSHLRAGDTVVVTEMSRLGRSIKDILDISQKIADTGADLILLLEKIDTSTPAGELYFNITASFSQFNLRLIREATKQGLQAAKAKGRLPGRPRGYNKMQLETARQAQMYREAGQHSVKQICEILNISRAKYYRFLNVSFG